MSDYITYISGGLLGDFIHQLSVICELYHKTNKKDKKRTCKQNPT